MSITFTNYDNYVEVVTPESNLILLKDTINLVCTSDYSSMTLSATGALRSAANPQLYTGVRISVADITSPTGSSNEDVVRQIQDMLSNQSADKGAFHDTLMLEINPIVQIQAVYGLREKVETFTATGGSVSVVDNKFVCQTGTSVGGYGVIRSLRPVVYKPGQGLFCRGTAMFDSANALANSFQTFGMFNATDGLFFGYLGANYGINHEYGGRLEIQRLTLTVGAGGAETGTVTL